MANRRTIALLFGGRSGEHEVSVRSAESVARGLAARFMLAGLSTAGMPPLRYHPPNPEYEAA